MRFLQPGVLVGGWLLGWFLLWRVPRLRRVGPTPESPGSNAVSLVIPARNEERSLPHLLRSLAGADSRVAELVVVDDNSADSTAQVASAAGARVVSAGVPPAGIVGKSWACQQGVEATTAPSIVFVDADVTFSPGGLSAVIDQLESRGGLVSVEPYHRVERLYERASALFGVVSMMGTAAASPGPRRPRAAFGPVLACRREDYEAVGGHAASPGAIAEDMALAAAFADAGRPVSIFGGGDLVSFRMYPDGPMQLVEGWSKNMATGAASIPRARTAGVALWVTAVAISVQGLAEAALTALAGHTVAWAPALVVYALVAVQLGLMMRQLGRFGPLTAVAYPLLLVVFVALFARSMYLTGIKGEVRWRDRPVPLTPAVVRHRGT